MPQRMRLSSGKAEISSLWPVPKCGAHERDKARSWRPWGVLVQRSRPSPPDGQKWAPRPHHKIPLTLSNPNSSPMRGRLSLTYRFIFCLGNHPGQCSELRDHSWKELVGVIWDAKSAIKHPHCIFLGLSLDLQVLWYLGIQHSIGKSVGVCAGKVLEGDQE